jgi:hypothetical protein
MTPHQIVVVGLRLLAVAWVLFLLGQAPMYFAQAAAYARTINMTYIGVFWAAQLLMCTVVWFFPASIARKLLPSPKNDVVYESPAAPGDWLTLGLIVIGLWVLFGGVTDAIYWLLFLAYNPLDQVSGLNADAKAAMITTVLELVFGTWLVFGAKGLGALLWKIRTGGVSKNPD